MKLGSDEELVDVDMIDNPLEIMVFTHNAEALRFRASEVSLYGTNAGGVKSIVLKPNDYVVSAIYCNKNDDFLLLTTRSTLKRMKVTDVVLTKRARAGSSVIKLLKSNPYLLVQASKLTPNQYKENVLINIIYKNGNDTQESFSLKYNVSDSGKTFVSENLDLKELCGMNLPLPIEPDKEISGDYLIEVKDVAPHVDDGAVDEKPIVNSKKEKKESASILDELNDILFKETGVKPKNVLHPDVDDNDSKNKGIKYKKISLFDDF
jgi:topoisomerase-4 subunit A